MKLYRLAHCQITQHLKEQPQGGCIYCLKLPYFAAFESSSATILESHVLLTTGKIPATLRIVEYLLPYDCSVIAFEDPILRVIERGFLENLPNSTILRFLTEEKALIATFPSANWRNQANFLVNPLHPQFQHVIINRIYPCT